MRMLGVDPGSRATGYGILESSGSRLRWLASGVIRPGDVPLAQRFARIHAGLSVLIADWSPDEAAFEAVFHSRNPRSALVLGQARGAALAACGGAALDVAEYSATQVKASVVGYGAASKTQVQHMVQLLLGLPTAPSADAADALAVAICHAHHVPQRRAELRAHARDARRLRPREGVER